MIDSMYLLILSYKILKSLYSVCRSLACLNSYPFLILFPPWLHALLYILGRPKWSSFCVCQIVSGWVWLVLCTLRKLEGKGRESPKHVFTSLFGSKKKKINLYLCLSDSICHLIGPPSFLHVHQAFGVSITSSVPFVPAFAW